MGVSTAKKLTWPAGDGQGAARGAQPAHHHRHAVRAGRVRARGVCGGRPRPLLNVAQALFGGLLPRRPDLASEPLLVTTIKKKLNDWHSQKCVLTNFLSGVFFITFSSLFNL